MNESSSYKCLEMQQRQSLNVTGNGKSNMVAYFPPCGIITYHHPPSSTFVNLHHPSSSANLRQLSPTLINLRQPLFILASSIKLGHPSSTFVSPSVPRLPSLVLHPSSTFIKQGRFWSTHHSSSICEPQIFSFAGRCSPATR